jgi:hypothetical protein
MSKIKHLKKHAHSRAKERFGVSLSLQDQLDIVKEIQSNGKVVILFTESCTRTHWAVYHDEQWLPVVYTNSLKCLYTVLPQVCLLPYKDKINTKAKTLGLKEMP